VPSRRGKNKYQKLGANLRKVGLLPSGYKLSDLSKNQKDRIIKLARKYPGPANRPADFVAKRVTTSTAKKLRAGDYRVKFSKTRGKGALAVFEKHGAEKISIRNGQIVREYDKYSSSTLVGSAKDIHEKARKFFRNRRRGEYLMLRIGDSGAVNIQIHSMAEFDKYVSNMLAKIDAKHPGDAAKVASVLSIVKVRASGEGEE
jgi:mRNA-degrading endonuclease RelE of RelBE toxin-antitoxin system